MALFFHVTALSGGEAFPCFAESHRKAARERHVPLQQDEPRHRPQRPPSPPASRHHHRTPMNDTAITTARALFPRACTSRRTATVSARTPCCWRPSRRKALPPCRERPPEGGGTGQRLRCGPAGPVPVSLVRHGGNAGALPSGRRAAPPMPPARSLQKHPPLPLADSRREKAAEDTTPLTCTLWGWSRTRPYALRPRQTPAF